MPAANYLPDVLETTEAERLATGFVFTEVHYCSGGLLVFRRYSTETSFFAYRPGNSRKSSGHHRGNAQPSTCRALDRVRGR